MAEKTQVRLEAFRDLNHKINSASSQSLRDSLNELGDSVSFSYRYCPDVHNPGSMLAAKAIIAAESQGKSEELYQMLAGNPDGFTEENILHVAKANELDLDQFKKELKSQKVVDRINTDLAAAKSSGLDVFPGLTIDGVPYTGAWDDFSLFAAIEKRGGQQIKRAIEGFFHWGASAAAVLIFATIAALIYVNTGFNDWYEHLRHLAFGFSIGEGELLFPLEIWINDFLMAIFFLMIGLEIKKEVIDGELSDRQRAAMPVIGAVGGMVVPALFYALVNVNTPSANGWGIPMATDIAFTLGLMALLGTRIPISLKIFISALAVADDLGAILVIALFYGHGFHLLPFLIGCGLIGVMFWLNRRKVFNISLYLLLGIGLWFCLFESGLHATLAGVITAVLIPVRGRADLTLIAEQSSIIFDREIKKVKDPEHPQTRMSHQSMFILRNAVDRLREPSEELMHSLERVVNFFILPVFAFFNTGILLSGMDLNLMAPANLGILLGLVIGKPLGITGACWLAAKAGIAQLSSEIKWPQLIGASCLAGVGFTMSIVVASSAFHDHGLAAAKISILIASTLAAILGLAILFWVTRASKE